MATGNVTSTSTSKTYTCRVKYDTDMLTIRVLAEGTRQERSLTLRRSAVDALGVTSAEQGILYAIEGEGLPYREFDYPLTIAEMNLLVSLKKKDEAERGATPPPTNTTGPVVVNDAPVTPTIQAAPVVVAPIDANTIADETKLQRRLANRAGDDERKMEVLHEMSQTGVQFIQVNYDIQAALNSAFPNPSKIFEAHGFRQTNSVWIFVDTPKSFRHPHIQEVLEAWKKERRVTFAADAMVPFSYDNPVNITTDPTTGIKTVTGKPKVRLLRQAESENETLRLIAVDDLCALLRRTHISLLESLDSATKKFDEAREKVDATEKSVGLAQQHCDNTFRAALRSAAEHLNNALSAAEAFDLIAHAPSASLEELRGLFQGLRDAIESRTQSFNLSMRSRPYLQRNKDLRDMKIPTIPTI